jgi:isocitrate/isopropylmalate dehydrogenase
MMTHFLVFLLRESVDLLATTIISYTHIYYKVYTHIYHPIVKEEYLPLSRTTPNSIPIMSPPKTYNIASIPGDGIGVDITQAAEQVLHKLASTVGTFTFNFTTFDWSSKKYLERGWYMPPDGMQQLARHDAIYFGAVGWPDVPDHISLWSLILPIRKHNNQYVNVRPTRILPGTTPPLAQLQRNPAHLDWVIIRENSEGEYAGQGGTTHENSPHTVATELAIFTRVGIERIVRFAFETAKARPRRKLTMVTKSNAQRHGMVLWDK